MQKLPGVASVEVSLTRAVTEVTFKPENAVTLAQLRDIIKDGGFKAGETHIVAAGRLVERSGQWTLEILPGKWTVTVKGAEQNPRVIADARRADGRQTVELSGTIEGDVLTVKQTQFPREQERSR